MWYRLSGLVDHKPKKAEASEDVYDGHKKVKALAGFELTADVDLNMMPR